MKTIVLLSGGLDSTVLLADRFYEGDEVIAVSFDYGQTHRAKELAAARAVARRYAVPHRVVGLSSALLPSALTGSTEIPETHAESPDTTTVPGRNLILFSIAAAIAESENATNIAFAGNRDDHAGYLDCRPEFIKAAREAIRLSTSNGVGLFAPYASMTKAEVVAHGRLIGAPIELSWSCYRGEDAPCNRCGACISRNEAMK